MRTSERLPLENLKLMMKIQKGSFSILSNGSRRERLLHNTSRGYVSVDTHGRLTTVWEVFVLRYNCLRVYLPAYHGILANDAYLRWFNICLSFPIIFSSLSSFAVQLCPAPMVALSKAFYLLGPLTTQDLSIWIPLGLQYIRISV
jgi:hypothetical protein